MQFCCQYTSTKTTADPGILREGGGGGGSGSSKRQVRRNCQTDKQTTSEGRFWIQEFFNGGGSEGSSNRQALMNFQTDKQAKESGEGVTPNPPDLPLEGLQQY